MNPNLEELATLMWRLGVFQFGDFQWVSRRAPFKLDCTPLVHSTEGQSLVVRLMQERVAALLPRYTFGYVVGVPNGMTLLAKAYAEATGTPFLEAGKIEAGGFELFQQCPPDTPVLVLEDVVTTGTSTARLCTLLSQQKCHPDAICSIVSHELGGVGKLSREVCRCTTALVTGPELLNWWYEHMSLPHDQYGICTEFYHSCRTPY